MAVIDNISSNLLSFKVNGSSKSLIKVTGTYGTYDILNGGEVIENELEYTFNINGLSSHVIKNIIIRSLLLDSNGGLSQSRKIGLQLNQFPFSGTFNVSDGAKTIINTPFSINEEQIQNQYSFSLKVTTTDSNSFYYGLAGFIIELSDIPYQINFTFSGPNTYRSASKIDVAPLVIKLGSQPISFSKDPTKDFDISTQNVEGRAYFAKDGIYVDGYQYSVNQTASNLKKGIVQLQDSFVIDENDAIIAPSGVGVAATPLMVYDTIQHTTDYVQPASTEQAGKVIIQHTFEIDPNDGGIIAPVGEGVAASPQLVYNTLATAKAYVDEQINNIPVIGVYIEDNNGNEEKIDNKLVFSNDLVKTNNKIYINWLEIS